MLFSEHYHITYYGDEEWFDPILHQDTRLFIDPFAVFKSEDELFKNSYSEMMYFFQQAFELIAISGGSKQHLSYRKAEGMLLFPEVNAICLGYSHARQGAGTGPKWAKTLTASINSIIKQGITNISHFEELGIFCEGIGPDRLSDMTANLLKLRFITYTQRICNIHHIPMKKVRIQNAYFDYQFMRWCSGEYWLPVNPYKNNSPVILIPKGFLNVLPEINTDDFIETIQLAERLRNDLNYEIDQNLDKERIAQIAIENYSLVKEYIQIVEQRDAKTFEENTKSTLRYSWYGLSKDVAAANRFAFGDVVDEGSFFTKIHAFVNYFKDFVEFRSGYKLLWNDTKTTPRSEEDVQLLFKGLLDEHCRANNIDFTREVNQGMGPVDFRFSCGYRNRVLLEAKLAKNTRFWNGLKKQLPQYMKTDSCYYGIFLVVVYTDKDMDRINDIEEVRKETAELYGIHLEVVIVDARPGIKTSASK